MSKNYSGIIKYSKDNNEITKQSLKDALIELIKVQDYDSITISKLCTKAGVSRMSFYRNYSIIQDLFNELALDLNIQIIEEVGSPFRKGTTSEWYIDTFEYIKKRKDDYLLLSHKQFQEEWMKAVNSLVLHDKSFPEEKIYQRLMWCGGFENVASYWVASGMKESVEEISDYCLKYLPHITKESKEE